MSRFALIPASGIGDGLIMLIAAYYLQNIGHKVTVHHCHIAGFGRWLKEGDYLPPLADWRPLLRYDAVLLQYDNTERARSIASLRKDGMPVYIFYPTYQYSKHGPLVSGYDIAFDPDTCMVDNCCKALQRLFGHTALKNNGMTPPPHLVYRKYPNRILIHPTSASVFRNWPKKKFICLADKLQRAGFDIQWILSSDDRADWCDYAIDAPLFSTLEELACAVYESGYFIGNDSGPGHLASCLSIPHLIISHDETHMRQWRPGWRPGHIICPSKWIPNVKGLRWRTRYWKSWVSVHRVYKQFKRSITYRSYST
jgi:heptosyltransferase-3